MSIRRAFWLLALVIILTTVADRLLFVIFPIYLLSLDFSATEIGLIFSIAALLLALFRLLIGKLSDLRGRKGIMSLGLLADSAATALFPSAGSLPVFAAVKGVKEVSYNLTSTMEDALIGDSFPKPVRPRILSRLGTVFPLGRALAAITGFLVVTWLSAVHGFYAASLALFLAFLLFTIFYRESRERRITSYSLSLHNISKPLLLVSLVGLCNSLAFSIAYSPGFFILAGSLGLGEADIFLMLLLTYAVSSLFAWRTESWIRGHGKEAVLGIGALCYGLFTMAYALSSNVYAFLLALVGVAVSFYVYRIAFKNCLLDATSRANRGEQVGFSKMLTYLGSIAGPVAGGLLIDLVSLQAAFLAAGSFGILGFFLAMRLKRP